MPYARILPLVNSALNLQNVQTLNANCHAVNHALSFARQQQKKGLIPMAKLIKSVKPVSCVKLHPPLTEPTNFDKVSNNQVAMYIPPGTAT